MGTFSPTIELCLKEWAGNREDETVTRNTRPIRQLESHVGKVFWKRKNGKKEWIWVEEELTLCLSEVEFGDEMLHTRASIPPVLSHPDI